MIWDAGRVLAKPLGVLLRRDGGVGASETAAERERAWREMNV